ncbi:MAG: hypothetical protein O2971_15820 [Proteobacteria bacterium]|nr:hypothetical protein [Pseudomonadota bacterium]
MEEITMLEDIIATPLGKEITDASASREIDQALSRRERKTSQADENYYKKTACICRPDIKKSSARSIFTVNPGYTLKTQHR